MSRKNVLKKKVFQLMKRSFLGVLAESIEDFKGANCCNGEKKVYSQKVKKQTK